MDYAAIALQTKLQIAAAGVTVVFNRKVRGGYDPDTGTYTTDATLEASGPALLKSPYSGTPSGRGKSMAPDGLVKVGDILLLVAAHGMEFVPDASDAVTVFGRRYIVEAVSPVFPGGVDLLYYTYCRRGA